MKITEARLNDLVYLTLKKLFFEPIFGVGAQPRECDIRICMDMACPGRATSIKHAILLPNEKAGTSHVVNYDVEPDKVYDVIRDYMVDHWLKMPLEEAFLASGTTWTAEEADKAFRHNFHQILTVVLAIPEEECGR